MKSTPAVQERLTIWEKPTIELPPGWKAAIERIALDINGQKKGMMRYVWALAADQVLRMNLDEIKKGAREIQRLEADDFASLVMRHCDDPAVASKMSAASSASQSPRSRRGRESGSRASV